MSARHWHSWLSGCILASGSAQTSVAMKEQQQAQATRVKGRESECANSPWTKHQAPSTKHQAPSTKHPVPRSLDRGQYPAAALILAGARRCGDAGTSTSTPLLRCEGKEMWLFSARSASPDCSGRGLGD
ncbi:hypothetical protein K432DRAFT_391742 [Lepidopterella palustris CBS 459.81]|uniref:Secreted protein n=1 Tax=Lepidopterella palustris CBS 459.81 TaxID=1314670 RepID=A0A8E2ED71_9PEZI|nr:hypothetical protein K432DRAFT_391742 [Lepidopterella palustris CBS 459.81]